MSEGNLSVRTARKMREIIRAHIARDTHLNESEFVREAIREKLQREAPDLYERLVRAKGRRDSPILRKVSGQNKRTMGATPSP